MTSVRGKLGMRNSGQTAIPFKGQKTVIKDKIYRKQLEEQTKNGIKYRKILKFCIL
jgi:hypothetical protein